MDLLLSRRPGLTELALAKSLFGRMGYQQRVNSTCRHLFREGRVERHGRFRFRLRRDGAGRHDLAARRDAFPGRLEHQDDDGRGDRAAGPGRKIAFRHAVSKYVEGVPNGDNITISELLKMRSGLYNYTSAPELGESPTTTQQGFGPRRNCSPSPLNVPPSSRRARNTTIATPTTSCSVSSPKSLKARRW